MYGPIANLPGYNPNATYLPPGMAAPSSYPERTAPRQQFYDMAPLPSVVDQSILDLASSGLSSSDPFDSAFGPTGIAGGIGGPDGKEYKFLNDFIGYLKQPDQSVPPSFTGPSNDQYGGVQTVPPVFAGPQQPPRRIPTVSAIEGDQLYDQTVPPNFSGPSADYGYGALGDLQQYYQQPQQPVGRVGTVSGGDVGGPTYYGDPQSYGLPQSMQGYGLPSLQSLADKNGVIDTYSSTSMPSLFSRRGFDSLTNSPDNFGALNAVHLGLGFLGLPGKALSAGLGAFGLGGADTGNPVLNNLSQAPFGLGTNNMPRLPDNSPVYTDPGATGVDWSDTASLSPAEKSLRDAYSRTDTYDTTGKGWQLGSPIPATDPFAGSQTYGVNEWESQYANPATAAPIDTTWSGNNPAAWGFNADPWAGDFGAGRYADSTTNPYSDAYVPGDYVGTAYWSDMFGPFARFGGSDPNNTD